MESNKLEFITYLDRSLKNKAEIGLIDSV